MANAKNIAIVALLKEKLAKAKSVVLTDYRGLTHKQSEELHRNVKKAGGEFVVAKNSLLEIASQSSTYNLEPRTLSGPTGAILAYEDELAPLKELFKTIKSWSLPAGRQVPKIKFGTISGIVYNEVEIDRIAKLPSQDILRGKLVNQLNSPIYSLVYSLNFNIQKLVYVLEGVKNHV